MNSLRLLVSTLVVITAGLMLACGSSKVQPPQPPDVYVAGYEVNGSNLDIAKYWKNGTPVTLGGGTYGSWATSIFVSGSDVYVAGREGSATHDIAKYWKNGIAVPLTDGTGDGYASSIFVDGNDVYVAGTESLASGVATYWKNGVPVDLTDGTNSAFAWSIFVSGTDVYVAGYEYKTTQVGPNQYVENPVAKYWKNGVPTELNDGLTLGIAYSIFLAGNDIYVAGELCQTMSAGCNRATYWKNGTPVVLTSQTQTAADSIVASGADVYVAGNDGHTGANVADFWKDGNFVQLVTGSALSAANQVVVSGNDVYVGGANTNSQGNETAGYWKNGVFVPVTDGTDFAAGFAMTVVQH
jgi:hypothetical protein